MRYLTLLAFFIISTSLNAQNDSSKFYSVNVLGREIGTSSEIVNEFYLQSTFGYKFNKEFGVSVGAGFIYYENLGLMPVLLSLRKSPSKNHVLGFNFDLGYITPLFYSSNNTQYESYKVTKGGSFFSPSLNILMYDGVFNSYLSIGYRVYTFTEEYINSFQFGPNATIIDRIIRRSLFLGVTFEF
jgi:hypothetical protein